MVGRQNDPHLSQSAPVRGVFALCLALARSPGNAACLEKPWTFLIPFPKTKPGYEGLLVHQPAHRSRPMITSWQSGLSNQQDQAEAIAKVPGGAAVVT
jgi:hypothetical protein